MHYPRECITLGIPFYTPFFPMKNGQAWRKFDPFIFATLFPTLDHRHGMALAIESIPVTKGYD